MKFSTISHLLIAALILSLMPIEYTHAKRGDSSQTNRVKKNRQHKPRRPSVRPQPNRPRRPSVRPQPNRPRRPGRIDHKKRDRNHKRYGHRPNWHQHNKRYNRYRHIPYRRILSQRRHYSRPWDYHNTIPYRYIYWDKWLRVRHANIDGFLFHNNYPFYVYNGYIHRYSSIDRCNYELVDGVYNYTYQSFNWGSCRDSYDSCADTRDSLNYHLNEYRYFCAEKVDESYNYNWDYNDDFYDDVDSYDDYSYNNYSM